MATSVIMLSQILTLFGTDHTIHRIRIDIIWQESGISRYGAFRSEIPITKQTYHKLPHGILQCSYIQLIA